MTRAADLGPDSVLLRQRLRMPLQSITAPVRPLPYVLVAVKSSQLVLDE